MLLKEPSIFKARATATAHMLKLDDPECRVMGACWCGKRIFGRSLKCLEEVDRAKSRAEIRAIAGKYADLKAHLNSESYAGTNLMVLPKRKKSGRSGWVKWRQGSLPGSSKWPSGAWNWDSIAEWRQLNGGS